MNLLHRSSHAGARTCPHLQQVHTHASGKRHRTLSAATASAERDYFDYYEAIGAYDDAGAAEGGRGFTEADLRLAASLPMLRLISELRNNSELAVSEPGTRDGNGEQERKQVRRGSICIAAAGSLRS